MTQRHFTKQIIHMAHKHMNPCSSLTIREMQVKTTIRFYLIPIKIATIKIVTTLNACKDADKVSYSDIAGRKVKYCSCTV